ncbi:MAG: leucine-rich repeat domain-containing protein, partial [Treponema sp.]|nr:leucine-rich repeat domain-containing protein [Treponema sp.]
MIKKTIPAVLFLILSVRLFGETGLEITVEENNGSITIKKSKGTAKTLVIPDAINGMPVTVIGDRAFTRRDLTELTIPDSVTIIGEGAFSFNRLTSVRIGSGVTSIGRGAFMGNRLADVTIGGSVREIGRGAFSGNEISSLVIPEGLTLIDDYAFFGNR